MSHGYICKGCDTPSPTGVGYIDNSEGAQEASAGIESCECGQSTKAAVDLMSRYALRNITAGQADVYARADEYDLDMIQEAAFTFNPITECFDQTVTEQEFWEIVESSIIDMAYQEHHNPQ